MKKHITIGVLSIGLGLVCLGLSVSAASKSTSTSTPCGGMSPNMGSGMQAPPGGFGSGAPSAPPEWTGTGMGMPPGMWSGTMMNPCGSSSQTKKSTTKISTKDRIKSINACRIASKSESNIKARLKTLKSCIANIWTSTTSSQSIWQGTSVGGMDMWNADVSIVADTNGYMLSKGTVSETNKSYSASSADTSAIVMKDGATYTLSSSTITKSGDSSSDGSSSFYGLNAGVIAKNWGNITLENVTINSTWRGANGAFATGEKSILTMKNSKITAKGDGAHAFMATWGGTVNMENVDMYTTDTHSAAIATDRGGGTVNVDGGTTITEGADSPGIYSTGDIKVKNADVKATGAEAAVIEGTNSITLTNTKLATTFLGKWGVMLFQSFSGDANGQNSTFTMNGGSLSYTSTTGPLFLVTNTTGNIYLNAVSIAQGTDTLLYAGAKNWGNSGSNGGNALLNVSSQSLKGNIVVDSISTADITLKNNSSLNGAIDTENAGKTVNVTLDSTSTWTVTGESHVDTLSANISDGTVTNIIGNGYTIYYKSSANSTLGWKTYTLTNGGKLIAE